MVVFMYGYGQPKKGQYKRPVYAGAVQVKDGTELDLALYTLYAGLKVNGKSPTVTATKNGIRFTYTAER